MSIGGKDNHSDDEVTVEGVDVQQAGQQATKQVVEAEERQDKYMQQMHSRCRDTVMVVGGRRG